MDRNMLGDEIVDHLVAIFVDDAADRLLPMNSRRCSKITLR